MPPGPAPEALRGTAFSADPAGGNPAGVVLGGSGLDEEAMLGVAAELGYSESAFLTERTGEGAYTVGCFSPKAKVPFRGHASSRTRRRARRRPSARTPGSCGSYLTRPC